MVKPADVPEYLTRNISKRHSPTVVPSVATPGLLVLRELMRGVSSSMEFEELVDILSE